MWKNYYIHVLVILLHTLTEYHKIIEMFLARLIIWRQDDGLFVTGKKLRGRVNISIFFIPFLFVCRAMFMTGHAYFTRR